MRVRVTRLSPSWCAVGLISGAGQHEPPARLAGHWREVTRNREGLDHLSYCRLSESLNHIGVYQKLQRHAAARSSDGAAASASNAVATCCAREDVASRIAALTLTVSLIVLVPSYARAIANARSSMSIRCFPTT